MMPNLFAMMAGIGLGIIIVGFSYYFDHSTPHNYDDDKNKRKKQNKDTQRCFDCKQNSLLENLISLGCGHKVHESCIYDILISCKAAELKKYKCPSCLQLIPYNIIKNILCSRCCVCKKEFDRESCCLPCGHKMHKPCLELNVLLKNSIKDKTTYECPYKLIECAAKMDMKRAKKLAGL